MTYDKIGAFLADYQDRCNERGIEAIDDALLRPILEDFVLDEPWWESDDTCKLEVELNSLRTAIAPKRTSARLLRAIENEAKQLNAKLQRQVYANVILREQNVLLAESLRRTRGPAAG